MKELTYERAVELLDRAVADKGEDYRPVELCTIYELPIEATVGDWGTARGRKVPSCIVGYAIWLLVGDKEFQGVNNGAVDGPLYSVGYATTEKSSKLLELAQIEQDTKQPWGVAVARAKQKIEEVDK